ncbi:hypothetical protein [Cyclobacterium plantarum]|uniref:hypothetical protein n=1 Tax=Cyclobacterium plantarum TaxID=2716263 RepID=UPI003F6E5BFC
MMKTKKIFPHEIEKQSDFPNLLVKTHFGNVFFQSMIKDKKTIVYINPSEIIPRNNLEKKSFLERLKLLKDLNFHLIGFNCKSFDEHLNSVNWVNSYVSEDLIFPIFYQTENEETELIESPVLKKPKSKNPVYFLNQKGRIIKVLNESLPENRSLEKIAKLASEMVLGEQNFRKETALRDN